MSASDVFTRAFNSIRVETDYCAGWESFTGSHLPNAVSGELAPAILPGSVCRSVSPNGRRVILIGTQYGNVVINDRNPSVDGYHDNGPCVMSTTKLVGSLKLFDYTGVVSERDMLMLVGSWGRAETENFGFFLKELIDIIKAN